MFGIEWWIGFSLLIFALLAIDLAFLPKRKPSHNFALTAAWIAVAGFFAILLYITKGSTVALQFTTGYIIEKSMSIDNLFVFLIIFQHFQVPPRWQQKILMYGIIGAIFMRLLFIIVGLTLIQMTHWMLLIFGAFLVIMGIYSCKKPQAKEPPKLTFLKKLFPVIEGWETDNFFIRHKGKLFATPAFIVLATIETTDLIFALDSIPAIFAITLDPFIVFSSTALAVIGLRAIFFVLNSYLASIKYLHLGISLILIFVGCKMLLAPIYAIDTAVSLAVISTILLAVILWGKR